jgi:selenocysteine-specific elongation factor
LRVRLHAFTSDTLATVLRYESDATQEQNAALIRLKLFAPLLLAPGDRFVLRQASPPLTIGGGRVLDTHPLPGLRKAAALAWLKQINAASRQEQLRLRVVRQGVAGISLSALIGETALTEQALGTALEPLLAQKRVMAARSRGGSHHLLAAESLEQASAHLLRELGRMDGEPVSRAELRSKTRLSDWVFELALKPVLAKEAIQANRDNLRLVTSSGDLSAQDAHLAQVEELYIRAGLASPILGEVSEKTGIALADLHRLITQLLRAKKLVRMGADNLFIHADALDRLTSALRQHRGETFDVARFKSFTGLTRKHAIPLLEYLDRMHVTRNNGGTRAIP